MSTQPEKRCGKCNDPKPATPEFFHRQAKRPDGLQSWCKVCMCAYQRDYAVAEKAASKREPPKGFELELQGNSGSWSTFRADEDARAMHVLGDAKAILRMLTGAEVIVHQLDGHETRCRFRRTLEAA